MSQLVEKYATAGQSLAHGGNLLAQAEALCHAVAGRDLGATPLYVFRQSLLPSGYFAGDDHFGFTTPSLDLYVRDYIPE